MTNTLIKSSSRIAMIAAAGVVSSSIAAKAADLGGDCCADLEERVAELEQTTARKGNTKVSLTVYGQINRALLWHDDDNAEADEFSERDNSGRSGSRFGFKGSAPINAEWSAGFLMEIGVDNDENESNSFSNRHTMLYIKSKSFGTLKLGRTSTATDGIAEIALASAGTPYSCEEADEAGVYCSPIGLDGGRRDGIHYVSPVFAGFSVSASWFQANDPDVNNDQGYDVALRYAGEFGAIRVAAGVGYASYELDDFADIDEDLTIISGSGSIMHVPSGVFLNFVVGEQDIDGVNAFGWYVSGGVKSRLSTLGATTLEIGYGQSDVDGIEGNPNIFFAGISQNIDAAAMDVYLNYQFNDADGTNFSTDPATGVITPLTDDASAVTLGARIKF